MNHREELNNHIAIQSINNNKIYIYSHPDYPKHNGWLKIGTTSRESDRRIDEQNKTANITWHLEAEILAQDINGNVFIDKDIHRVLERKGVPREKNQNGEKTEWFKISLEQAKEIIQTRIDCREDFEMLRNEPTEFKLRPNQQAAVDKTYARWQISQQNPHSPNLRKFLWNAKPRFGKTLTAYEFAQKIGARKVLIVTQRTSISDSWHKDYFKWIKDKTNYVFGSTKNNQIVKDNAMHHRALSATESHHALQNNQDLIFYISFADIKGRKDGEFKAKNKWIFDTEWDLFIIDETHEGSSTDKAMHVFDNLKVNFQLELSGTPFKKLKYDDDYNDKNTYSWSYTDEQESKENWDYAEGKNPYAEMPRLSIFTYQLSSELRRVAQSEEYSFDFNEFFKNDGEHFLHEDDIKEFLDKLSQAHADNADATVQYYPFADAQTRDALRHTFWLLPQNGGVNMTKLLKKLLNEHAYFKDYDIIMAAADGDDDRAKSDSALDEVLRKIGNKPYDTKTITLSCGQLTTGITVEAWTAVLMLNNLKTPEQYLQAAFRSQNPWSYELHGETKNKTDAYVFDFAPDRVLKIVDDYANVDVSTTHIENKKRESNIKILLNHLSVISQDETGEMKYLNPTEVLTLPNYISASAIVDNGFMDNRLFSIGNLFNLPQEKRGAAQEILNKLEPVKNKKLQKSAKDIDTDGLDEKITVGDIAISESGVLGEKRYATIETEGEDGESTELQIEFNEDGTIAKDSIKELIDDGELPAEKKSQVTEAVDEFNQQKKKQITEEEKQRDRLRGFSRSMSLFLMAYGKPNTTLANFETFIGNDGFLELTSITKDEFRFLRDDCHFFDEPKFNAAIKEFLRRKEQLGRYFDTDQEEDIFSYIPPQKTNQIFTPKKIVNQMLDLLEAQNPGIFRSTKTTFFDPNMKSGQYITEIAKRLYKHSHDKDIYRILKTQLFGFAPTRILADITHAMILGFEPDGKKRYELQKNFQECSLMEDIKQADGLKNNIIERFGDDMKFDVIIGNPPYQEEAKGTSSSDDPIYHKFMDGAYKLASKVCFITPARFLFNAGKTPKKWNEKMLADPHLQVMHYEQSSAGIFPSTDIKGGVAITYRDSQKNFGAIETFTSFDELNSILKKVAASDFVNITPIIFTQNKFNLKKLYADFPEYENILGSGGKDKRFDKPIFHRLNIFTETPTGDSYKILGMYDKKRAWRYIPQKYVEKHENLLRYKVILPVSNGSGAIGETLSTPLIGEPLIGYTRSFIGIGAFETNTEAQACLKYIKSKFARTMLGVLKITQDNTTEKWAKVPLQNFTTNSDIDWSRPIPEIDQQLYKKYGLTEQEIEFIESKVKEMK